MSADASGPTAPEPGPRRWPRTAVEWRAALAVAAGRPHGPDSRSFATAVVVCAALAPLAAVDTVLAVYGATALLVGVVLVALAGLALCTFVLVTAYLGRGEDARPRDAAQNWFIVLWSVAALGYGIETASATAAVVGGTGSLSAARDFFLWHVFDTLPVFTVTDTLYPTPPTPPLEAARAMALILKIALILPLIRIAVAAFRLADGAGGSEDPRGSFLFTKRAFRSGASEPPEFDPMRSALRSAGLVVACGVVLGLMLTVCNWLGLASRWVASALPRTPARWVRSAADGILYGLGLWACRRGSSPCWPRRWSSRRCGSSIGYCVWTSVRCPGSR